MLYHGLLVSADLTAELRFPLLALVNNVWASQLRYDGREPKPWPFRLTDDAFSHLEMVAAHLVRKLECAAALYAKRARDYGRAVLNSDFGKGDEELAIFLDAVIVYLRMLADLTATITPYFYRDLNPPAASFRDHIKWFTSKRSGSDPEYEVILRTQTEWFELLAGRKVKGLRDRLIHQFGRFQFPVTTEPAHLRGEVSADFFTKREYHFDALRVLPQIAQGMCEFFDAYAAHFNKRIATQAGWLPIPDTLNNHGLAATFPELPDSKWLFPVRQRAA